MTENDLAMLALTLASMGAAGSAATLGVLAYRGARYQVQRGQLRRIVRARLQLIQDGRL